MIATKPPDRVLIIKPSSLGDVVHGLPFLHAVRRQWPETEVHWLVAKGLEGILRSTPGISRLILFPKDEWRNRLLRSIPEVCRFRTELRSFEYDMAVDLQGLLRSGLMTAWSGAGRRVGFAHAREGAPLFYTERVDCGDTLHAVDRNMAVARALGCDTSEVVFGLGVGRTDDAESERILKEAGIGGAFVAINPGARWKSKIWPAERFGRVASKVRDATGLHSVVTGGPADTELADEVCTHADGAAVSLAGRTSLGVLSGVLSRSRVMLTNDSGPMHMAVALGRPVVAIFGPTDPAKTGPYGVGHVVLRGQRPCAPCRERECADMGCILDVGWEDVSNVLLRIVKNGV